MRINAMRGAVALAAVLACSACGKKSDPASPLAFVPADTPYLVANLEPMPDAVVKRWSAQMQSAWPMMFGGIDQALIEMAKEPTGAGYAPVLRAVLDEVRERNTPEKWQEIGLDPKGLSAFYGVGLLPVLRMQLTDPDAFRAAVARIEQKAGSKLGVAKIGEQDVWTFGNEPVIGLMAIESRHLVVTMLPSGADDALKRRVLGMDRPAQSVAESGAMAQFNKTRGYLPYASGWIDMKRLVALVPDDPAIKTMWSALHEDAPVFDAACRSELDAMAANVPLLAMGYTKLDANRMDVHARIDLAPALAAALVKVGGTPPGPASKDVLFDMGVGVPVLRARDFWVAQAEAMQKAPFACALLAPLNASVADAKKQMDVTIPPPFADLTGLRISLDRIALPVGDAPPDVSGRILVGSTNPAFLTSLAQMTVPALANLKFANDGTPVAIPSDAVPGGFAANLELHAAIGSNAFGIAVGKDQVAALKAAVTAPAGDAGVWMDASYSGKLYDLIADGIDRYGAMIPAEQRAQLDSTQKLYRMYSTWFKRFEFRVSVNSAGIDLDEGVEFANP